MPGAISEYAQLTFDPRVVEAAQGGLPVIGNRQKVDVAEIVALTKKRGQAPAAQAEVESLLAPLAREGKGESIIRCAGPVGIGVFVPAGEDPRGRFWENEAIAVACDCEIYNHKELAREYGTDGVSEASLIGALYLRHGKAWWEKASGVFRAVIADKTAGTVLAFTDRVGVKNLLYCDDARESSVASRLKCLSARPGHAVKIDAQAVYSYLFMEMIPTPYTVFQGIKKLESGHFLKLGQGDIAVELFWKMPFPAEKLADEAEIRKRSYDLLKAAVNEQFDYQARPSEVGAFLSGGTDSSTICGLIDALHPGEARTFSIGFDEQGFDETYYARLAAKAFNTKHTEYYVTAKDVEETIPLLVDSYDEPFANSSAIPTFFCSKVARENGVNVMLAGDGGDEIFGGNSRYREVLDFQGKIPPWMARSLVVPAAKALGAVMPHPLVKRAEGYARRSYETFQRRIHDFSLLDFFAAGDVFQPRFMGERIVMPDEISLAYLGQAGTPDLLDQYLFHDIKLTLMDNDLRKVTRMAQVAGIRVRFPYLDTALMEFTGRIPPGLKVKQGRLRHIFKETFKDLLPGEIIEKKKHGFGLPVVRWMLRPGKLNDLYRDAVFGPRLRDRGIFKPAFLETLQNLSRQPGTEYLGKYLYYIFFLELWLRAHVDGPSRNP